MNDQEIKEIFLKLKTTKEKNDFLKGSCGWEVDTYNCLPLWQFGLIDIPVDLYMRPVIKKLTRYDMIKLLYKYTVSKDDLRTALTGVYHDPNGGLVATDGHQIIMIKGASDKKGRIVDENNHLIKKDATEDKIKFPNYLECRPKDPYKNLGSYSLTRFTDILQITRKIGLPSNYTIKIGRQFFSTRVVNKVTNVLHRLGINRVILIVNQDEKLVPVQLTGMSFGKTVDAWIMPYYHDDTAYNFEIGVNEDD